MSLRDLGPLLAVADRHEIGVLAGRGRELVAVSLTDEIHHRRARCQPHLLRLRMLVRSEAGMSDPLQIVTEIAEATGAVLGETEAADCAARAAAGVQRGSPVAAVFLRARLSRLAAAAEDAVAAARAEDFARMRHDLRRFEALTSATWTVQDAVYGPPPHGVPSRDWPGRPSSGCRHRATGPAARNSP
jgi:hypothetical protein